MKNNGLQFCVCFLLILTTVMSNGLEDALSKNTLLDCGIKFCPVLSTSCDVYSLESLTIYCIWLLKRN